MDAWTARQHRCEGARGALITTNHTRMTTTRVTAAATQLTPEARTPLAAPRTARRRYGRSTFAPWMLIRLVGHVLPKGGGGEGVGRVAHEGWERSHAQQAIRPSSHRMCMAVLTACPNSTRTLGPRNANAIGEGGIESCA